MSSPSFSSAEIGITARKSYSPLSSERYFASRPLLILSILLMSRMQGVEDLAKLRSAAVSEALSGTSHSTTNKITSVPPAAASADFIIYSPSSVFGLCSPGVSVNTYCVSPFVRMPVMRLRVVCGLRETMATFSPSSALSRVDLPTFGLPIIDTKQVFSAISVLSLPF